MLPLKVGESDKCKFSGGLHKDHRMHPTIAAISIPPLKVGESDKFDKKWGTQHRTKMATVRFAVLIKTDKKGDLQKANFDTYKLQICLRYSMGIS